MYLLVGWLKAMTIRLMKLVNSSYPHHTFNYNKKLKHIKGGCYDKIGNQDLAANWMSTFINDEVYKKKSPWERNINWIIKVLKGVYKCTGLEIKTILETSTG